MERPAISTSLPTSAVNTLNDRSTAAEIRTTRLEQLTKNLSTAYAALPKVRFLESLNIVFRPYEPSQHSSNKDLQRYSPPQLRDFVNGFDRLSRQIVEGSLAELQIRSDHGFRWNSGTCDGSHCTDNWLIVKQDKKRVDGMGVWYATAVEAGISFSRRLP